MQNSHCSFNPNTQLVLEPESCKVPVYTLGILVPYTMAYKWLGISGVQTDLLKSQSLTAFYLYLSLFFAKFPAKMKSAGQFELSDSFNRGVRHEPTG